MKTIDITTKLPFHVVANTLIGAFEGGSNYWIDRIDWGTLKDVHKQSPYADQGIGSTYADVMTWAYENDITTWCMEIVDNEDGSIHELHVGAMIDGVQLMAQAFERHYDDMVAGRDDSTTSDVLLQCMLFQDVHFG